MAECAKLTEEKLFECLKSLNVPCRLSDLKTPTSELVFRVFDSFLKDLHINIESLLLRPFAAIKHMDNPDICKEGQILITLSLSMTDLLSNMIPLNITVYDITAPKPKRTKKLFNYIIIFWNNYLRNATLFQTVEQTLQPELQEVDDLKSENEDIEQNFNEIIEKRKNANPELFKIISCKEEKIGKLQKHRENVVEDYRLLKEKESDRRTEMSNVDIDIVTKKEKLNELEQLIISSPEKISTDIQKVKDQIRETDQKIQERELAKKEQKKKNQSAISAQEDVVKINRRIQEIINDFHQLSETVQNLSLCTSSYQEENEKLKVLLSTQEQKNAMVDMHEQEAAHIQLFKNNQIKESTATYENLKRQISDEKYRSEVVSASVIQEEEIIDKKADDVIELVNNCKKAKAATERIKSQYASCMQSLAENFRNECKEIVAETKRRVGFQ